MKANICQHKYRRGKKRVALVRDLMVQINQWPLWTLTIIQMTVT